MTEETKAEKRGNGWFGSVAVAVVAILIAFGGIAARRNVELGRWPKLAQQSNTDLAGKLRALQQPTATDQSVTGDEAEYFFMIADLLRTLYVEPVKIDEKMSEGAVKGMVNSLIDSHSRFYDAENLPYFKERMAGNFGGTGVEVELVFDQEILEKYRQKRQVDSLSLLPDLVVKDVIPGSSAEAAGIKSGDIISKVGDKFIISGTDIRKFRKLQEDVTAKKASADDLNKVQLDLQTRAKTSMVSGRARDLLTADLTAPLKVSWRHGDQEQSATLPPKRVTFIPITETKGGCVLKLIAGAANALSKRGIADGETIDLRHSGQGDSAEMYACINVLVSRGQFGTLVTESGKFPLTHSAEPKFNAKSIKLLVDETTRGAAAVFAKVLVAKGIATMDGAPSADDEIVEFYNVDDKTGYTLLTGKYSAEVQK